MIERVVCTIKPHPFDKRCVMIIPHHDSNQVLPKQIQEDIKEENKVEFKDNSIYEFEIPNIKGKQTLKGENVRCKYITSPNPCYVDLKDVTSLANGLKLEDESVLYHIREASRHADHIVRQHNKDAIDQIILEKETIKEEVYGMYMFIKYKALKDCILDFYIKEASRPNRIKNQTGDLVYEHEFDLERLRKLIEEIEEEYEKWRGELTTITADPKSVLRGKYSWTKYYPTNLSTSGYSRDNMPTGYDIYGKLSSRGRRIR